MFLDICPICDSKLGYMRFMFEQYSNCPTCKKYWYSYTFGQAKEKVGNTIFEIDWDNADDETIKATKEKILKEIENVRWDVRIG